MIDGVEIATAMEWKIKYAFDETMHVSFGRKINPKLSSIPFYRSCQEWEQVLNIEAKPAPVLIRTWTK